MLWRRNKRKLSVDSLVSSGIQMSGEILNLREENQRTKMQLQKYKTGYLLARALLDRLFKWAGEPWDTPEGFTAGCKFCGKPFPRNFRDDIHYGECVYEKIQVFLTNNPDKEEENKD